MYLRNDHGLELAGGTTARSFGRAVGGRAVQGRALVREEDLHPLERLRVGAQRIDWVPDLGAQIGSAIWWRGLLTCAALMIATWTLAPGFRPVYGDVPAPLAGAEADEARAQGIAPLALGADTGRRMAANDLVVPLADAPERPSLDLSATIGAGDDFGRMLERAGVGGGDARAASALVGQAVSLGEIAPGTRIALTLGRRPNKMVARPLDKLAFRARFDLALSLTRAGAGAEGVLVMNRQPIAVDRTPLRIEGLVGSSLYRSARAAGAPAKVVEAYIKAMATRLSIGGDIHAADSFDMVIEQARAATGETRTGDLLFAGIDQGARKTQLVRWTIDGSEGWYDADGRVEQRGQLAMPVSGHVTSTFGWRIHPLLGFTRFHKGLDIGAPYGTPIHAVVDATVIFAGRAGGYGNFVRLSHGGGLVSGYGHMSRIAVAPGQHVRRGEVIGYVGSTGLSTGAHLHWEIWRNGVAVNPQSFSLDSVSRLSGDGLRAFRTRVASLLAVRPGGR